MTVLGTAPGTLIDRKPTHVADPETVRLEVLMPTITEFPLRPARSHPLPQVEVKGVAPLGTPLNVIV